MEIALWELGVVLGICGFIMGYFAEKAEMPRAEDIAVFIMLIGIAIFFGVLIFNEIMSYLG